MNYSGEKTLFNALYTDTLMLWLLAIFYNQALVTEMFHFNGPCSEKGWTPLC